MDRSAEGSCALPTGYRMIGRVNPRGPRPWALAALVAFALPATASANFTQEPGSPYRVGADPFGVLAGDFSGDGRPDIVTVNGTASTVSFLRRRPTGGFEDQVPTNVAGGPNFGAAGDFNGDGVPDVAVANFVPNAVSILRGQPGGGFAPDAPVDVGFRQTGIAAADFDLDGDPDLAALNWFGNSVSVLINTAGTFALEPGPAATGLQPRHVAAADFNGDRRPDLAVANFNGDSVTVLLRRPAGGFTEDVGSPIAVGDGPFGVVADDINGDGRPDIGVVNFNDDTITLLIRNQGNDGFGKLPAIPVDDAPSGIATSDFNSDGRRDIVTANATSSVSVLLGAAGGGFTPDPDSPVRTDTGAFNVAVADFNADNRPDLAVTNVGADTVTVLLNVTPFPPGAPPPPPVNLDADGDGVLRPRDCRDDDPSIFPGAHDVPRDGIDQDCSGRDERFPLLDRRIEAFLTTFPGQGYTKFTAMRVIPVRKGDRLRLTCRGRGCPLKKKTITVRKDKRRQSLLKYVKGAKLRRGAQLQLRVTRPQTIGRITRWRIRVPKTAKITRRCIRPTAKKPGRCPA
jgi:FG-GAP-like repeat/Putative metal-binding motif